MEFVGESMKCPPHLLAGIPLDSVHLTLLVRVIVQIVKHREGADSSYAPKGRRRRGIESY